MAAFQRGKADASEVFGYQLRERHLQIWTNNLRGLPFGLQPRPLIGDPLDADPGSAL